MTNKTIEIDGIAFRGTVLETAHAAILLIQGKSAHLGCGYFSLGPADKLGDRFAIVTGVKSFEDMLAAPVRGISREAAACGVETGMTGREALLLMEAGE